MRKRRIPCGFHCIKIKDLSVSFGEQAVLSDIDLHIHCGTLTAVIGRNGAGKSTLIRAILGEIPHGGTIEFKNTEDGRIKHLEIGYVPQKINIEKNTPMDVYDLIASFRSSVPVCFRSKELYGQIRDVLAEFAADDLIDRPLGALSGGQLQRVLLSMAVMEEPNLLLLDEPVSGIDKVGMDLFYEKMRALTNSHDMAVIIISHDLDYVAKYADNVILLDRTVLCEGTPKHVYESDAFKQMFGGASYTYGALKPRDIPISGRRKKG